MAHPVAAKVISVAQQISAPGNSTSGSGVIADEGVFADLDARGLRDGALMGPVHDRRCLGGHVRRGVRVGDDRERDVVATIKAAGRRLQIERGKLRARRGRDRKVRVAWNG